MTFFIPTFSSLICFSSSGNEEEIKKELDNTKEQIAKLEKVIEQQKQKNNVSISSFTLTNNYSFCILRDNELN